jgi:hypothetical protein
MAAHTGSKSTTKILVCTARLDCDKRRYGENKGLCTVHLLPLPLWDGQSSSRVRGMAAESALCVDNQVACHLITDL